MTDNKESIKEKNSLEENYYKRYGVAYRSLLAFRRTVRGIGLSLQEVYYLLKRKK